MHKKDGTAFVSYFWVLQAGFLLFLHLDFTVDL